MYTRNATFHGTPLGGRLGAVKETFFPVRDVITVTVWSHKKITVIRKE
jgi:hypothetical protein